MPPLRGRNGTRRGASRRGCRPRKCGPGSEGLGILGETQLAGAAVMTATCPGSRRQGSDKDILFARYSIRPDAAIAGPGNADLTVTPTNGACGRVDAPVSFRELDHGSPAAM